MPSINFDFLTKYIKNKNLFENYPCFVETGTFRGETTRIMEKLFKTVHTIEIKEEFYKKAKTNYNGNKITFHLGDSSIVLNEIVHRIDNNTVFFLDGHWSCGNTGRGKKDCPLLEELKVISNNFNHHAIIIIDDCRLLGRGPMQNSKKGKPGVDWKDITYEKMIEIVKSRLVQEYFVPSNIDPKDRLVLHLRPLKDF